MLQSMRILVCLALLTIASVSSNRRTKRGDVIQLEDSPHVPLQYQIWTPNSYEYIVPVQQVWGGLFNSQPIESTASYISPLKVPPVWNTLIPIHGHYEYHPTEENFSSSSTSEPENGQNVHRQPEKHDIINSDSEDTRVKLEKINENQFESSKDNVKPENKDFTNKIQNQAESTPFKIIVAGDTDNRPQSFQFKHQQGFQEIKEHQIHRSKGDGSRHDSRLQEGSQINGYNQRQLNSNSQNLEGKRGRENQRVKEVQQLLQEVDKFISNGETDRRYKRGIY